MIKMTYKNPIKPTEKGADYSSFGKSAIAKLLEGKDLVVAQDGILRQ